MEAGAFFIVALLILSIETGDSKIRSATLEAATTTSEPNTNEGVKLTSNLGVMEAMTTSLSE